MRVLVVEDEKRIAGFIRQGLEEEGLAVDVTGSGAEADVLLRDGPYDGVVLDLGLPDLDGLELLRRVRAHGNRVPVLVLTARDTVEDRVNGLDTGADDYLVKPFAFVELSARLRALLRRATAAQAGTVLQVADLELDLRTRRVRRGARKIELSPREFSLLDYLLRHRGEVVTRTMIAEHVWDHNFEHFSNVIDVYVGYLRKKVDREADEPKLIHTVRGVGYVLAESAP